MKKITIFTICILSFFKCFADSKLKASIIIKNGIVLTMNKDYKIIDNGVVVILDNKIIDVGDRGLINRPLVK